MPVLPSVLRRPRRLAVWVTALALIATLAGCETDAKVDPAALTDGLLVLSGSIGATTLELRDTANPDGRSIALPDDAATAWISAGRTNVLAATVIDGQTYVSESLADDDPGWRLVEAVTVDDTPPELPLYFATWDPPGGAYAQLGASFATGDGMRVVVTDPTLEGASVAPIPERSAIAAPPAWIDDDRVVVVAASNAGGEALIVDTTSGDVSPGPDGVRLVATSAEGTTVAVWRGGEAPIEVLETEAWLDGQEAAVRITPPSGGIVPAAFALDRTGDRLAIVWTEPDGGSPRITISARAREWATSVSFGLGDVEAASVAWLR